MRIWVIAAALASTIAGGALASERHIFNGAALLDECARDTAFCNGFLLGIDAASAAPEDSPAAGIHQHLLLSRYWCTPTPFGYAQARPVVVKWLREHSNDLQRLPAALVAQAYSDTLICK